MSKANPSHYQQGSIEVWDYIVDQQLGYLEGNVIKYISRAGKKGGESRLDDLQKAQAYIFKLITNELNVNSRSPRPSDPIQESNGAANCYDEYDSPYDATLFDR